MEVEKNVPTLSVVMPVFNEKPTLEAIVQQVLASPLTTELIIVDDCSVDGTRDLYKKFTDPRVHISLRKTNGGKGAALQDGFKQAKSEYVIIQDADLEYDPAEYEKLLKPVIQGKSEVVYGSRFTGEHRNMLFWHWMGNKFLSFMTSLLYNTTLSDMETCYKLVKRDILNDMTIHSKRFDVEPELTAKILKKGIRIYEVPISYAGREFHEGKKITWRDGIVALWVLFKYRFVD